MQLTEKTIVITGASRGIGAATARAFAAQGARVGLIARDGQALSDLAAEIGKTALGLPCDISDFDQLSAAVQTCTDQFGTPDVLINNAGAIEPISHLSTADPAAWGKVIDINLKGVFYGMRTVLPAMIARGSGTILTIGSGAAHGPVEGWSHYCSSKAGALMLTRMVHKEAGDKGVRALSLSPGTVATQMQREIKASGINPVSQLDWSAHIPPEWVAQTLVWMCSEAADPWMGDEISLRDPDIRSKVGLA